MELAEPCLSWHIKLEGSDTFSSAKEIFAGAYTAKHDIVTNVQLWNNRWGTENVKDLSDFYIRIAFEKFEDSSLLPFCTISLDGKDLEKEILGDYAIVKIPSGRKLIGQANNGVASENLENYVELKFTFHIDDETLAFKENDLKSLYLTVITL